MSGSAVREADASLALGDGRPWAWRRVREIPDITRCATCRRKDARFLVLDNRDMKWRCAACASPGVAAPAGALSAAPRLRTRRTATPAASGVGR